MLVSGSNFGILRFQQAWWPVQPAYSSQSLRQPKYALLPGHLQHLFEYKKLCQVSKQCPSRLATCRSLILETLVTPFAFSSATRIASAIHTSYLQCRPTYTYWGIYFARSRVRRNTAQREQDLSTMLFKSPGCATIAGISIMVRQVGIIAMSFPTQESLDLLE